MAQAGFTPIQLYHSATPAAAPTAGNLIAGELAINTADGILYYEDSAGVVKPIAQNITPVANGGTGVTTSTGTGNVVLSNSPTLVTPALGTPSALVGTNITGTAAGLTAGNVTTNANLTGAITSTGNATVLGSFSSANLAGALTDETGSGSAVFATSPTLVTPALGTPSALVGTNITGTAAGLTAGNVTTNANLTGAITSVGNATSLGSFSSANLAAAVTDETGTGALVFANSPTLVTPALGTPASGVLTNTTGLPLTTGVTGTLPVANGGTGLTSYTANGIVYASGTGTLASSAGLQYNGKDVGVGGAANPLGGNIPTITATGLVTTTTGGVRLNSSNASVDAYFYGDGGLINFGSVTNHPLAFFVNNAEQMRLTSTGLGIGTSNLGAKLDVNSAATTVNSRFITTGTNTYTPTASTSLVNTTLQLIGGGASGATTGIRISQGGSFEAFFGGVQEAGGAAAFVWQGYNGVAYAERMRLDSSGNLYVGTTSAPNSGEVRQLLARAGATYLQFQNTTTATGCTIGTSDQNFIVYTNTNSIGGGGGTYTERARIDSSGNLLVGTTTARTTLTVAGSISLGATPAGGVAGTAYEVVGNSAASGNANGGDLTVVAGGGSGSGTNGNLTLRAGQTISTGSVTTGGNLILESGKPSDSLASGYIAFNGYSGNPSIATERARITSDGYLRMASGSGGIQFNGDTAAANALDDYETGTFTPTISGSTSAGTGTYSGQLGRYTKIGNRVSVDILLIWSAHTGTGDMQVTDLPFTIKNIVSGYNPSAIIGVASDITLTASNVMAGVGITNTSYIRLDQYPVGGGTQTRVSIDTSASLAISINYEV
jgi:hypothetical protein